MTSSKRYAFDVELLEDMHTGTGSTATGLNAVQLTDRHGRPVIRDSHLRGLIRESVFELVKLGQAALSDATALCGAGGPGSPSAMMLSSLRCKAKPDEMVWWTSTARKRNDRGPERNSLRTREYVPAGTSFSGEIELLDPALKDLFSKALFRISHVGSGRNRGDGLIKSGELTACESKAAFQPTSNDSKRLRLILTAVEPLCIPTTGRPENVIPTESFIRGQSLQGAIVGWLLQRGHNVVASSLVNGDGIERFGNAYPLPDAGVVSSGTSVDAEVIPIPLGATQPKPGPAKSAQVPWWAEDLVELKKPEEANQGKPSRPKPHEYLFRSAQTKPWQRYQPTIRRHMRNDAGENRRDDDKASTDLQLYAREEIAEDTQFLCDLEFATSDALRAFVKAAQDLLNGTSWLKLGKGGLPVSVDAKDYTVSPGGREGRLKEKNGRPSFVLTFVSDAIIRSTSLGFLEKLDAETLCRLVDMPELADKIMVAGQFDAIEVSGFNATSGLPRLSAIAIRRGSQARITAKEAETDLSGLIDKIEATRALGERQTEGFGRVELHIDDASDGLNIGKDKPVATPALATMDSALANAKAIAAELNCALDQLSDDHPSSNQIFGLRDALRRTADQDAFDRIVRAYRDQAERRSGAGWASVKLEKLRPEADVSFPDHKANVVLGLRLIAERQKSREQG